MSASTPLMYWQEKLGKSQARSLDFVLAISGAKASAPIVAGAPLLTTYDAIAAQATINNFLGTTNEFTIAQFDATAMGNDAFGGLVNMQGQVALGVQMVAYCYSASNTIVTRQVQVGTLTDSTLETAYAVGAYGNLGFKVDFGNTPDFDGLTAGTIVIHLEWISK